MKERREEAKAELFCGQRGGKTGRPTARPGAETSIGGIAGMLAAAKLECSNVSTYTLPSQFRSRREAQTMATTLTSREFNQDTSGAKKAASEGPVFITDRGRPAHVLLTIKDYLRLSSGHMSLAEALAQANADFDFGPPRIAGGIFKAADLD